MSIFGLMTRKEYERELQAIMAKLPQYEDWQLATAGAEKYNLPDPSIYGNQADLYRKLSWVLLAVDLTAAAGSLTPFEVKRIVSGKEPKDIPNHPFEILLSHPNELDSRFEFLYATIAMWKLTGNAYWWLNRTSIDVPPDEMWFIPSQMIQPVPDEHMYLKGYLYNPGNGMSILLEPHEIIHFKRFNPFSRFVGLSAIESIALVAQGDLGMQDWNTRLFKENNARLPGIITFEQMIADNNWQKIKDDTREAARKRDLLMLRGVGQGGVNWLQNAVSQKDMEFLKGREFNQKEIMTTIAPGSYSMLSENSTMANSVVGRASFNELTVYPMHVMMAEKITNEILPAYTGRPLVGIFEDIRITDKAQKLAEDVQFALSHTLEEVREEIYGDGPLGDERDNLLIAQIKADSGGIQKVTPPQFTQPAENETQPDETTEQPETEPNEEEVNIKADLARWKRKALKKIGQAVPFESEVIPDYISEQIASALPACKSEADVRAVFDKTYIIDESRVALTIEAIRQALNFKAK